MHEDLVFVVYELARKEKLPCNSTVGPSRQRQKLKRELCQGLFASLIRKPYRRLRSYNASDSVHVPAMTPSKKSWVIVSTGLVLLSFLFVISLPFFNDDIPPPTQQISKASFRAPKQNVWADLSEHETDELVKFLFSRAELNLTDSRRATA